MTGQLRSHVDEKCKNWLDLPTTITTEYDIVNLEESFEAANNDNQTDDNDNFAENYNNYPFLNDILLPFNYSILSPSKLANYQLPLYKWGMSVNSQSFIRKEADVTDLDLDSDSDSSNLLVDGTKSATCNARILIHISPKPFTLVRHQMAMSMEGFLGRQVTYHHQ